MFLVLPAHLAHSGANKDKGEGYLDEILIGLRSHETKFLVI